jgi:hypothetical protein
MLFNRLLPTPSRPTSITTLDGSDLEYVDNYKSLGVWLDCKLSFQTRIKHLQSKIKSRISFLYHNKASFTHAAKHTLVKPTILPILDFVDVVYKTASNTTQHIGCSLSPCHLFCHQSPIHYPPLRPVCSRWLALASYSSPNPLAIYKSLLGKVPPYLSTRAPAGITHWSPSKPISTLVAFLSSSLLLMAGTNCKNHWSWRLISPSLALSTSCQSRSLHLYIAHL